MRHTLHEGDLPEDLEFGDVVAVDSETMGLSPQRDRLCLAQLSAGDGHAHLVQIKLSQPRPHRLCALLEDPGVVKLFHFGRFDIAMFAARFGVRTAPVYCTKIASRLARTYTDRHGYRDVCRELLGVDVDKQQQSSDWGASALTDAQLRYAAADVLHLHALRDRLDAMLAREGRAALAAACHAFLPDRALLDVAGWGDVDIFAHA